MSRFDGRDFIGKKITMKFIILIYVLTSFFLGCTMTSLPMASINFYDDIKSLLSFLSKF